MIALGFAVGIWLAHRRGQRAGLYGPRILDLAFWILVSGVVGARLLYVVLNADLFGAQCRGGDAARTIGRVLYDCTAAVRAWEGGLVFFGGGLCAAAASYLFARREGWSFGLVADVFAPSLALGHAFGRIGCFFAGCCFGRACVPGFPLGVSFPPESVAADELARRGGHALAATPPLHPTQLYEAGAELALFALLTWLWPRKRAPGQVALVYALGYAIVRFVIEMFRGDRARRFVFTWPAEAPVLLSTSQIVALGVALGSGLWLAARRARAA